MPGGQRRARGRGLYRNRGNRPNRGRGVRGRGRASNRRGRQRRSNRAHRGRDIRRAQDQVDVRLNFPAYAGQSFTRLDDLLYCQCCNKFLDHRRKSTIDRHLGIDESQPGNTKNGIQHKNALIRWNAIRNGGDANDNNANGNNGESVYSDLRSGFILILMKAGCNACQTAYIARELFRDFPMANSGTVPQHEDGM